MLGPLPSVSHGVPESNENARLVSLDVFRGVTVAGMVLVTDPGTYSAVYWPLLHARWNGPTPTDMIFPSFLVIVGIAMTLSFASCIRRTGGRRQLVLHVLRRSAVLFFLGLVVNGFPDYELSTIRIQGVLQRIAVCYLAGALLYLYSDWVANRKVGDRTLRRSTVVGLALVTLLAVYWALLKLYPVPGFGAGRLDSLGNVGAYWDRSVLGIQHMWPYGTTPGYGVSFDPEGLLSTVPALATLLIGVLAGEWMQTSHSRVRKFLVLAGAGVCLVVIGYALSPLLPLNKKIWTSTFALLSGGVALLIYSFFYFVIDIKRWRRWITPALVLGTNAIFAFVLSNVLTTLTDRIHVTARDGVSITVHKWVYQYGFGTWLRPVHASLAYAFGTVLVNTMIVYLLYRKRIFLRV